jgi:formylmethanofuran dehydrogenase subunit E
MPLGLRAWWYEHFVRPEEWPPDVRERIARRGLKQLASVKDLAPEVQEDVATKELTAALSGDNELPLDPVFKSELLADAMSRLGKIPLENCSVCGGPVFTHKAVRIDGKLYCESCSRRQERGHTDL